MGNSYSSSEHICFESHQDDILDSINYKRFEPPDDQSVEFKADCPHECLNSIKLFETIKKENAINIEGNEHPTKRTFLLLISSYSTWPGLFKRWIALSTG